MRENNGYCFLLRMAHFIFLFINNGGIGKGTMQRRLTNGTHFSCYEGLPKGYNVQISKCLTLKNEMLCHAIVSDKPGGLSVYSHPLNQETWQYS